jgi:hypothetical protein
VSAVPPSRWTFDVAPYAWGVSLDGRHAEFGQPESDINLDAGTALNHLKAGFMLGAEARHGRLLIFGDVFAVREDGLSAPVPATVRVDEVIGTVGVGYMAVRTPTTRLDLVAGARIWSTNSKLTFTAGPLSGHSLDDGATWVDPFVGARGRWQVTDKIYALGWAEIGAGGGSDLMWDVMGGVGHRIGNRYSILVGYRAASVDYRDGPFVYDVVQHGPFAALVALF